MKTNYRHASPDPYRKTPFMQGFLVFVAGVLIFTLVFFATSFALRGAGTLLSFGKYIPGIQNVLFWFESKSSLARQNKEFEDRIRTLEDKVRIAEVYLKENRELKKALGRAPEGVQMVLGNVTAHPNISPYDTLVVDVGSSSGLAAGDMALGLPHTALGTILTLEDDFATVGLFSAPNRETNVYIGDAEVPGLLIGRGGGNFRVGLPKDVNVIKGDLVVLAEDKDRVVGVVGDIEEGADTSSISLLVSYPLNIYTIPRIFFLKK